MCKCPIVVSSSPVDMFIDLRGEEGGKRERERETDRQTDRQTDIDVREKHQ